MSTLSLVLFVVACLCVTQGALITRHGKEAEKGQFKYQAYISQLGNEGFPLCGGVILDEYHILTSANCVQDYISKPQKIQVHFGTTYVYSPKQNRNVAEIKIKDGYTKDGDQHNIALIKTTEKIIMSNLVQPVKLPENDQTEGKSVVFCGFGNIFVPDNMGDIYYTPFKLYFYETSTLSKSECANIIAKTKNVNDFICAKHVERYHYVTTYLGNPLVADNTLYGLSLRNQPNVFTNIFVHKQWIQDNLQ